MENKEQETKYYDGTKILSMKDLDGNLPELYMVCTNRTAGKTTYFGKWAVKRFLKYNEKFTLLYRYAYELDNVSEKFFKDVGSLFFPDYSMFDRKICGGMFRELYIHTPDMDEGAGVPCGYAIAINNADQVKKNSHYFSDAQRIIMDEFQSETNNYCSKEITKFISVHTSIARGHGKQTRYVPVYMLSNAISIINPYYVELGISSRLQQNTKYLRGHGWVLENVWVESASRALKESAFSRAFSNTSYLSCAAQQNVYLNDNLSFIEKPNGESKYLATIQYNGKEYALREYYTEGVIYCDDRDDSTYKFKIAVTTEDHRTNYVMLKRNDLFVQSMRFYFEHGCFRFKDLQCKEAVMKLVCYH